MPHSRNKVYNKGGENRNYSCHCGWRISALPREADYKYDLHIRYACPLIIDYNKSEMKNSIY